MVFLLGFVLMNKFISVAAGFEQRDPQLSVLHYYPAGSARVARNLLQILGLLGPSGTCCSFINTNCKQKGAPFYALVMVLEEALKT